MCKKGGNARTCGQSSTAGDRLCLQANIRPLVTVSRAMRYLTDFAQDLRYAFRSLRQSPSFTVVAVLSAALGIGACSTIFGIANFALFQSSRVREADRVFTLTGAHRDRAGQTVSWPVYEELGRAQSFSGVAAQFPFVAGAFSSTGGGADQAPGRHWGALVTENFFDVVQPPFVLGGGFAAGRHERSIVLSHALWRSRFGEDRGIVGRSVLWNGKPVTVAGVTTPAFRGTEALLYAEFWVPMALVGEIPSLAADKSRYAFGHQWLYCVGRLKDGVTPDRARAELTVIAQRLEKMHEAQTGRRLEMDRAGAVSPAVRQMLALFFALLAAVTALVLLVASANVANLLLARGAQREREIATRLAMGAGRGRLVRQLLTESLVLALLGGLAGCALAFWAAGSLGKFELPLPVPVDLTILLDARLLAFSTLLALVTGVLFGLAPAWRASGMDLSAGMKRRREGRFGLRNILVVAQVAISMVLLLCSGLFLRSLTSAQSIDIGMASRDVLLVAVDPAIHQYDAAKTRRFYVDLRERVQALPGVDSAAWTQYMPLSLGGSSSTMRVPGKPEDLSVDIFTVSPGYFATLGIPLRQGADFLGTAVDADAVLLNERAAVRAFGGTSVVGRTLDFHGKSMRVAGVVANAKSRTMGEEARAVIYQPLYEASRGGDAFLGVTLAVKTRGDAARMTAAVRQEIRALDPAMAVFGERTFRQHLERALILPRLAALMFGLCGAVALAISTIGLYGVVSFSVAQRTREIGIRMALGADRASVLGWVLRSGMTLAVVGIVVGVALGLAASQVTASLLYGVSTTDLSTFTVVPLFLALVVAVACWVPARRAAGLDPARTLRAE